VDSLLADLLRLICLERLELNLFRGESRDIGSPQVFGGQVLGQALMAATGTVTDRVVHSLHAYFLRRGDFNAPIVYEVDRSRDGRSFSSRRVVAIQHGQQIFHMSASFQADMAAERRRFWSLERPFEFRSVEPLASGEPRPGVRHLWFRLTDRCPDDQTLHRCLLAYMSDYHLLETATLPHGLSYRAGEVTLASIDHGMWFHRPVDINDWLLYALESPSSSGSRGFATGSIFDRQGRLVASTVQEGLMRVRDAE
jgi:acyl-CoA thioesterase-2